VSVNISTRLSIPLTVFRSHDPEAEGAVVMKPPTKEHTQKFNKKYVQSALRLTST
jgi:hypothetical protein